MKAQPETCVHAGHPAVKGCAVPPQPLQASGALTFALSTYLTSPVSKTFPRVSATDAHPHRAAGVSGADSEESFLSLGCLLFKSNAQLPDMLL